MSLPGPTTPQDPRNSTHVAPTYSYLSDKLRRMSAGSTQCSLFCGGDCCKYESAGRWEKKDKALRGLFSHWVTPQILAMARPSTQHIHEGGLITEFKRCGITSIINLQQPKEHPHCGPGLELSSGFTYKPEDFMNNGVFFYNYGWNDYGVPTLPSILNMVKVMDFALGEGKVAIHCHAGLGRTGVLIACYLVYSLRISADEAVIMVREKRPGSIQTRPQIDVVHSFATFLSPLWVFFPTSCCVGNPQQGPSVEDLVHNQTLVLHGQQAANLKDVPKVVDELCQRLMAMEYVDSTHEDMLCALQGWCVGGDISHETQHKIETIKVEINTSLHWKLLHSEPSPTPLLYLLSSFLSNLKEPILSSCAEAAEVLFPPAVWFTPPTVSECRAATTLRIVDTLGQFLQVAREASPTFQAHKQTRDRMGEMSTLTSFLREVDTSGMMAARLTGDLYQQPKRSLDDNPFPDIEDTVDLLMSYWTKKHEHPPPNKNASLHKLSNKQPSNNTLKQPSNNTLKQPSNNTLKQPSNNTLKQPSNHSTLSTSLKSPSTHS